MCVAYSLRPFSDADWSQGQAILTFLANTLEVEESPTVQVVLCVGLAKLLLSGLANDPKVRFHPT